MAAGKGGTRHRFEVSRIGGAGEAAEDDPSAASFRAKLRVRPLGAGQEVGRSCHILEYKGKKIMLDCGIMPSWQGEGALPHLRDLDPASVDIVVITHFHLDHAAALPVFTERMEGFRGRVFATHPTIAVMRTVLEDFRRISAHSADQELYSEEHLRACIARIEPVDYRQRLEVDGVRMRFLHAGHVLGAAMVYIEIDDARVLYTGDFSMEEDRHLPMADIPDDLPEPHMLICESTFGTQIHEDRLEREKRFITFVRDVVLRGGRCLVPMFAFGAAQELLLILDEYWDAHPDLQSIPIYYASPSAGRSMGMYRTYASHMSSRVQGLLATRNPFDFKHVRYLNSGSSFADSGPCVVMAPPGMLQGGMSRSLFERWCEDPKNGVIVAGYCVAGTLARQILHNPLEVQGTSRKLRLNCSVKQVTFASHSDSAQTRGFVDRLKPECVVLVHGEAEQMRHLHQLLSSMVQSAEGGCVFMPRNGALVYKDMVQRFPAQVVGELALQPAAHPSAAPSDRSATPASHALDGILVLSPAGRQLLAPHELPQHAARHVKTDLHVHTLRQRQHIPYRAGFETFEDHVRAMFANVETKRVPASSVLAHVPTVTTPEGLAALRQHQGAATALEPDPASSGLLTHQLVVEGMVTATYAPPDRLVLGWDAGVAADMIADTVISLAGQAEFSAPSIRVTTRPCGAAGCGCEASDEARGSQEAASLDPCCPQLSNEGGDDPLAAAWGVSFDAVRPSGAAASDGSDPIAAAFPNWSHRANGVAVVEALRQQFGPGRVSTTEAPAKGTELAVAGPTPLAVRVQVPAAKGPPTAVRVWLRAANASQSAIEEAAAGGVWQRSGEMDFRAELPAVAEGEGGNEEAEAARAVGLVVSAVRTACAATGSLTALW